MTIPVTNKPVVSAINSKKRDKAMIGKIREQVFIDAYDRRVSHVFYLFQVNGSFDIQLRVDPQGRYTMAYVSFPSSAIGADSYDVVNFEIENLGAGMEFNMSGKGSYGFGYYWVKSDGGWKQVHVKRDDVGESNVIDIKNSIIFIENSLHTEQP